MALPKKLISIDIGSERIKLVQIQQKGKKVVVTNALIIPTPDNAMRDGMINNPEELTEVLKEALTTNKIKEKNVVFTVSSSKIITREVELPNLSPKKLSNMIKLNAEEYFPVNLDEYCMDYTITDVIESEGGKKAKIIVFAALTTLITSYVTLADALNLNVVSIDYSGNSMVRFIKHEGIEGTNLFLDIGAESTMVTIMSGGVVKFSRNLLFGTRTINNSIRNHFEVDYEEATKISKERELLSFDEQGNSYLASDVTSGMEQILSGVSRLVDYYTSRNKSQVEKVYILGGGSEIYGASEYISRYFGIDVEIFNSYDKVIYKGKESEASNMLYYPAAIGASLSTINLLPPAIKNRDRDSARKRIPILLGVLVLVGLAALWYMKYTELNDVKRKIASTQENINTMSDINEVIARHQELTQKYEFRQQLTLNSTSSSDSMLEFIKLLELTMPKSVFLTSLADNGDAIEMNVTASSESSVAQFLTYLKTIEGLEVTGEISTAFSDVEIPDLTRYGLLDEEDSYVNVTITCTYNAMTEEDK